MLLHILSPVYNFGKLLLFFKDLLFIYLFIYLIYFWMCQVFVAAHGLFVAARRLLSSCGVWVFSLVVARSLQYTWAL